MKQPKKQCKQKGQLSSKGGFIFDLNFCLAFHWMWLSQGSFRIVPSFQESLPCVGASLGELWVAGAAGCCPWNRIDIMSCCFSPMSPKGWPGAETVLPRRSEQLPRPCWMNTPQGRWTGYCGELRLLEKWIAFHETFSLYVGLCMGEFGENDLKQCWRKRGSGSLSLNMVGFGRTSVQTSTPHSSGSFWAFAGLMQFSPSAWSARNRAIGAWILPFFCLFEMDLLKFQRSRVFVVVLGPVKTKCQSSVKPASRCAWPIRTATKFCQNNDFSAKDTYAWVRKFKPFRTIWSTCNVSTNSTPERNQTKPGHASRILAFSLLRQCHVGGPGGPWARTFVHVPHWTLQGPADPWNGLTMLTLVNYRPLDWMVDVCAVCLVYQIL